MPNRPLRALADLERYSLTYRFRHGHPVVAAFLGDGDVLFRRSPPDSFVADLYRFRRADGEITRLLGADDLLDGRGEVLSDEEKARRERMRVTSRGITTVRLAPSGGALLLPLSGRLHLVELDEGLRARALTPEGRTYIDARFAPDGRSISVVRDGDLYLIDVDSGRERRLTTRERPEIEHGLAEFVAQEEMDRMRGYWWSPDGDRLLYQRTDHSDVERWHIADPMQPGQVPRAWPYPRPGKANADVRLGVMDPRADDPQASTVWLEWDRQRYPYLNRVVWSGSGGLTLVVQTRLQDAQAVLVADPDSGETRTLFVEEDPAWVELDATVPMWIEGGEALLWSSDREGPRRLEVRGADGAHRRWLTPPELQYGACLGVDAGREEVWITAEPHPTEQHVYALPLSGQGEARQISRGPGLHGASLSVSTGTVALDSWGLEGAPLTRLLRLDGTEIATLPSVAEAPRVEPRLELARLGIESDQGAVDVDVALVRPSDFDPSRRYPLIVHVYGGPTHRMVRAVGRQYLVDQWLAEQGYLVAAVDGRGTPGRGRDWQRAQHLDFISAPLADQVAAVAALAAHEPAIDAQRVGIFGWSFGGYFAAMAALQRPDVFRAACGGAPVVDWLDYDTHYTERYLGLPEDEPEAYQVSNVLSHLDPERESAPLLLVHGTADDNVYFAHTLKLAHALLLEDRPHQVVPLTGLTHMLPDPALTKALYTRIVRFFDDTLG